MSKFLPATTTADFTSSVISVESTSAACSFSASASEACLRRPGKLSSGVRLVNVHRAPRPVDIARQGKSPFRLRIKQRQGRGGQIWIVRDECRAVVGLLDTEDQQRVIDC